MARVMRLVVLADSYVPARLARGAFEVKWSKLECSEVQ